MQKPLLTLENVSKYYISGQNVVAGLKQVSLSFSRGEFVAVTGESGSGKSTMGSILGGILPYEDGELYLSGKPTSHFDTEDWERYRKEQVSFISQNYGIIPGATVWDHVLSALRLSGTDPETWEDRGREILQTVELWQLRKRRAGKLSSGQKQRLAIARALAKPCPILVADEPTGNLDPENSAKVISLLAKAAKERLVILITHEYEEAAAYVTRHISLRDGRVVADARLREHSAPEALPHRKAEKKSPAAYIAGLQLKSRPVWATVMLLLFTLTAFSVFVFLGSFMGALDDTSTRIYRADAFLNGNKNRIVAVRKDAKPMTQEDYDRILGLDHVQALDPYGYAQDLICAYRPEVDYVTHYISHNYGSSGDALHMTTTLIEVRNRGSFVQTVPMLAQGQQFLTAGRLPENIREVVVSGGSDCLGNTMDVYFCDTNTWGFGEYFKLQVTVVGVTDFGQGIYCHGDVGKTLTAFYLGADRLIFPVEEPVYTPVDYVDYRDANTNQIFKTECIPTEDAVLRPLEGEECLISQSTYNSATRGVHAEGMSVAEYLRSYGVLGLHDSTLREAMGVSAAFFEENLGQMRCDQVGITIQDYAYAQRVIEDLDEAGYSAVSPYELGAVEINPELAAKRKQTLGISLGALIAIMALQLFVLRALFGVENESFGILANLGLSYNMAARSVILQLMAFALPAQLLGVVCVGLCNFMGIERIVNISKHIAWPGWVLMSGVHLLCVAAGAAVVLSRLRRSVFPTSSRKMDLNLEQEEVAEA